VENKTESRAQEGNAKNDTKSLSDNQQLRLELRRRADTCNSTRPPHFPFPQFISGPLPLRIFSLAAPRLTSVPRQRKYLPPFAASVVAISSATPTQPQCPPPTEKCDPFLLGSHLKRYANVHVATLGGQVNKRPSPKLFS